MDAVPRMGPPLPLGAVVIGRGAGVVEASGSPDFAPGDYVTGELGWQDLALVSANAIQKVDCTLAPLSTYLGLLASSGLTAYLTLRDCAGARTGETVVVSAAAGSVGLAACQLAMSLGCRVVALAHGEQQARFLAQQLQPAAVIDDTRGSELGLALDLACPDRVDVFLDSVGGETHNRVMERINVGGRAVLYGFISAYNAAGGAEPEYGRIYHLIKRRARMMGFLLGDHAARFPEVLRELAQGLRDGKLRAFESRTSGIENVPAAFAEIFGEAAPGKHLVRLAHDPTAKES
jgi:NADPH-dependent curcumin reductase CurA